MPSRSVAGRLPRSILLIATAVLFGLFLFPISACHHSSPFHDVLIFLIDVSPTNLDPRIGIDPQSERIDALLFDGLVTRDASYRVAPGVAQSWDQPDPLTLVFHLRPNVRFHDGRTLTSRDAQWTIDSTRDGTVITPKASSYASIARVDAPDPLTLILHLKAPDNFLLTNLATGAMGIVPQGSGRDFWKHPIGSGTFRFVNQEMDKEVEIERSSLNSESDSGPNAVRRVRFEVVPDATTRALELRKGSADIASNTLLPDMLPILAKQADLIVESTGGTQVQYIGFNIADSITGRIEVRQAIACAIDRDLILKTLLAGRAQPAFSLLPQRHWAWTDDVPRYEYDPARSKKLLTKAGYLPGHGGIRLHITMETSTDDFTRLLAATLQQQLAQVGIALDIRSYESATFIQDLNRGSFQMYALRWVGGNEQPDIYTVFTIARIPPKGPNRGRYRNPRLDRLLDQASRLTDQQLRRSDYFEVQRILAEDLPAVNLWYQDSILVHNKRLSGISISPSGSYEFLRTAKWQPA